MVNNFLIETKAKKSKANRKPIVSISHFRFITFIMIASLMVAIQGLREVRVAQWCTMPVNNLMPNATVIFTLKALFFWKQPRRFGKAMKKWRDAVFRKKTGKWECGTAGSPSPPPPHLSPFPYRSWLLSHIFFWYLQKRKAKAVIIRELKPVKQRRRGRQRERQKKQ